MQSERIELSGLLSPSFHEGEDIRALLLLNQQILAGTANERIAKTEIDQMPKPSSGS